MNKEIIVLGTEILPGKNYQLNFSVAKLHTDTPIQIPVIIERSKKDGPVLLIMAGVHGDEINGIEILRQVLRQKINKPKLGTVICIPVFNIFGFLNLKRELPDGRDLNRSFPGSSRGSLASQFAYLFMKEIAPVVDLVIDFHTGGALRSNSPQIRCVFHDKEAFDLAQIFNPPFIVNSSYIRKSLRETIHKTGKKILLFEGGKSNSIDNKVIHEGVQGIIKIMAHLGMIKPPKDTKDTDRKPIIIQESAWIRASRSGIFRVFIKNGTKVSKGDLLGVLGDPYGKKEKEVKAQADGYIFCINTGPIVNKGDALFHFGKTIND